MKVEIAKKSGFCFGVKKAIEATEKVLLEGRKVNSLGPLIHNNSVIDNLNKKGLLVIDNIKDNDGDKVIIRSHGIPKSVYEIAEENKIEIEDCTCPFVKKVQKVANDCYKRGKNVIIIGNSDHPEVIGINGWCDNNAHIVSEVEDIELLKHTDNLCVVVQTTMTQEKFETIVREILNKSKDVEIHNTICSATIERQEACKELSQRADAMIIIGGKNSSNTKKLVEISKKYCENVFFIENPNDIDFNQFKKYNLIGITGGASTPNWIIEEVYIKLKNINEENYDMSQMEEAINDSFRKINKWDTVEGEVVLVTKEEVIVNVGHKSDGIIKKEEFTSDPDKNLKDLVKEGEKITATVITTNDGDGNIVLSKKHLEKRETWVTINEMFENKSIIEVKVLEIKENGLVVDALGIRGFIPKSQISTSFVEDLSKFKNEKLKTVILDVDQRKNRLVLSSREVEESNIKKAKEEVYSSISENQVVKGKVEKILNYGAFIDIGSGVTGLLHISDMSWGRVKSPKDIVNEGDLVEVLIQSIDSENNKISLSMKKLTPEPWKIIEEKINVGDIVEGKVMKNVDFGSFVEVMPGLEGLVHISQISEENIAKPSDKIKEGDIIKVKVIKIDKEKRKLELSKKEAEFKSEEKDPIVYSSENDEDITIGDIIEENE